MEVFLMRLNNLPMMNHVAANIFIGILIAAISSPISARIGDSKSNLESRLLKANGIILRENSLLENRQTGMPYLEYEEYYPKPYEVRLYFKPADGRRPKPEELANNKLSQAFDRRNPPRKPIKAQDTTVKKLDGWELHVLYVKGVSVLELYKKTSPITEHEIKHLLSLQSGRSFWEESSQDDLPEGKFSALGFDLKREDGLLRANKLGPKAIMLFRSDTDEFFYKSQLKEQLEEAPESIKGF